MLTVIHFDKLICVDPIFQRKRDMEMTEKFQKLVRILLVLLEVPVVTSLNISQKRNYEKLEELNTQLKSSLIELQTENTSLVINCLFAISVYLI